MSDICYLNYRDRCKCILIIVILLVTHPISPCAHESLLTLGGSAVASNQLETLLDSTDCRDLKKYLFIMFL